jgi:hypothetical protein
MDLIGRLGASSNLASTKPNGADLGNCGANRSIQAPPITWFHIFRGANSNPKATGRQLGPDSVGIMRTHACLTSPATPAPRGPLERPLGSGEGITRFQTGHPDSRVQILPRHGAIIRDHARIDPHTSWASGKRAGRPSVALPLVPQEIWLSEAYPLPPAPPTVIEPSVAPRAVRGPLSRGPSPRALFVTPPAGALGRGRAFLSHPRHPVHHGPVQATSLYHGHTIRSRRVQGLGPFVSRSTPVGTGLRAPWPPPQCQPCMSY